MFEMRKRALLVSKFMHMLIVVRLFTTHLFPLEFFAPFMLLLLVAQYYKEGFTPLSLILLPLLCLQIFAELNELVTLQYVVSILGGILHFIPLKLYWLPEPHKLVGFREDEAMESGLHYCQFYPLDESESVSAKKIKWNKGKEVAKMLEHKEIKNKVFKLIGHFAFSYTNHQLLKVGEGAELLTNSGIAFSHGRGGAPFHYSTLLMHLAGLKFKVGAVQHLNDTRLTGLPNLEEIKRFREKEIQARAAEFYQSVLQLGKSRIVLMGHSYGCSTVLQAYHSMQPNLKEKVSQIVLLDPWLFPLSASKFSQEIHCPVLILANQDFLKHQDVYNRNREFMKAHKVEYVCWKHAHHHHQTDIGFINGNLLGIIKNSHLSRIMLDLNLKAIEAFLRGERVEGTQGDRDLGRDYKPEKFHKFEMFTF